MIYDVLIIGGGVVGSAIARELARYHVKVAVLEQNADVCCGNSGRNTGLLHAGFMYQPGSLKAQYAVEGNAAYDALAEELDVPLRRTGKLTVGSTPEEYQRLLALMERGKLNHVPGMEMIDRDALRAMEPHVQGEFALYSRTSALLSPYQYTIALAENAAANGVDYHLSCKVTVAMVSPGGGWQLETTGGRFSAKWVVNAAGLASAEVSALLGAEGYRLRMVRGEYLLLDKKAGAYLTRPVYPCPDENWVYDIHVTPTLDGNVLVGPTVDDEIQQADFETTRQEQLLLVKNGGQLFDHLKSSWVIRGFSGVFPHGIDTATGKETDFVIESLPGRNAILLVGINSPGLTSAYPIGRRVADMIAQAEHLSKKDGFNPIRKGILPFAEQSAEVQARLIAENPDYGELICRCERVSKAEILQALRNPLGVATVTGVKYRTRATMGRCQGGYCETRITDIIREELGIPATDVRFANEGSYMFTGEVRRP